jgi:hypothetical protein
MAVNPARLREIAQAVADFLNLTSQPWNGAYTFTARRSYWTGYKLAEMDPAMASGGALRVDVLLAGQDWDEGDRGQERGIYSPSVVVQQKVDRTSASSVDSLIDLMAAFADSFLIGKTFVPVWNGGATYAIGNFALLGDGTYRCILGHTNHTPPDATYWEAINPIMLLEKHNSVVYSPVRGDTVNTFQATLDLAFEHYK